MQKETIQPQGVLAIIVYEDKFLLVQRDNHSSIKNPGLWAPITGGVDPEDKGDIKKTILRELKEEIDFEPKELITLGISDKGVGFFFCRINKEEAMTMELQDEGQRFDFLNLEQISRIRLGGTVEIILKKYHEIFRKIAEENYEPTGEDFGLSPWKNEETKAELTGNFGLH
jgi:8-oxo-dGTP pyrophosphatase MutT (NUDIX family)